ncbi:hypothetical protein LBMAG46_07660 [Planctomycetia bacterium]|nr:hypothetical protein LBMAG46_07660 [Planctomycetia bacterium]
MFVIKRDHGLSDGLFVDEFFLAGAVPGILPLEQPDRRLIEQDQQLFNFQRIESCCFGHGLADLLRQVFGIDGFESGLQSLCGEQLMRADSDGQQDLVWDVSHKWCSVGSGRLI